MAPLFDFQPAEFSASHIGDRETKRRGGALDSAEVVRREFDDGDPSRLQILLIAEVLIRGDEHVELILS